MRVGTDPADLDITATLSFGFLGQFRSLRFTCVRQLPDGGARLCSAAQRKGPEFEHHLREVHGASEREALDVMAAVARTIGRGYP